MLKISTELGDKICCYYEQEKVFCPPELIGGLFTTAAVDNIDDNPSSISAHDSFHGTGISLFQHPDDVTSGVMRNVIAAQDGTHANNTRNLPDFYTTVPPAVLHREDPPVPKLQGPNRGYSKLSPQATEKKYR